MLTACWSVKGGSGTTVVATSLALLLARTGAGAVLADLDGDVPALLGLPDPRGPGLHDWMAAGPDLEPDALSRIEIDAGGGLAVVPSGVRRTTAGALDGERLALALAGPRPVVIDCGSAVDEVGLAVAACASLSLLVLRPCYLALRRALAAPVRPSAVVLIDEPGRSLRATDVEDVLGVPVRIQVPFDAAVARAVDAGILAARLPRVLERALRTAA